METLVSFQTALGISVHHVKQKSKSLSLEYQRFE
jgi:hypothetical protein